MERNVDDGRKEKWKIGKEMKDGKMGNEAKSEGM